jgi:hypothetical protein
MPLCDWDDMEVKGVAHLNIHCAIKSEEFAESRDRLTACYSVHSPALQENLPKLLMIRSLEALIKTNVEELKNLQKAACAQLADTSLPMDETYEKYTGLIRNDRQPFTVLLNDTEPWTAFIPSARKSDGTSPEEVLHEIQKIKLHFSTLVESAVRSEGRPGEFLNGELPGKFMIILKIIHSYI